MISRQWLLFYLPRTTKSSKMQIIVNSAELKKRTQWPILNFSSNMTSATMCQKPVGCFSPDYAKHDLKKDTEGAEPSKLDDDNCC